MAKAGDKGRKLAIICAMAASAHANAALAQIDAPAADNGAAESADIVVTAQRREQRLTDVPISVTAATGTDLAKAGISGTREIQLITPGLTLQSTGPWLQPAIRGVTSQATIPGSEQNVAIYIDGVYSPFAASNAFDLPDVQRIEVLKGPQGTLFGRNATGGAIQIFTLEPSFTPKGKFYGSYGRFHDTELKGYISGGLSETVSVSLSGAHSSSDGWNRNLVDGSRYGTVRSDIVRGKVLVQPSDAVKFIMSAFYSDRADRATNATSLLNGNGAARRLGANPLATRPYTVAIGLPNQGVYIKSWGASLRGEIDLGFGNVTTTTAYLKNKFNLISDTDSSVLPLASVQVLSPYRTYSQEVTFSTDQIDRLNLIIGGYLYQSNSGYVPGLLVFSNNNLLTTVRFKNRTSSYALFAEATYELTDKLSIIGGARYTYERRKLNNNYATAPDRRSGSFDRITPRVSAIYEVADNANVYFTYSQGFKSGQWDVSAIGPKLLRPELLKGYELGFKAASRAFAFSGAIFYSDYSSLQNQFLDPVTSQGRLENAGAAEIYGGELSLKYNVTPEFSLMVQGAYTHAKYTRYANASVTIPLVDANGIATGGNRTIGVDLSGTRLARAPRLSGNVGVNYEREFDSGTLAVSGLLYYSSSYGLQNGNRVKQSKYAQLNANASWRFGQTGLKVGVYGKNLTNRSVFLSSVINNNGDAIAYQEPRSYGINFEYAF